MHPASLRCSLVESAGMLPPRAKAGRARRRSRRPRCVAVFL